MSTVTIGIASVDEVKQRARRAFRGETQGEFITFPSVDVLTSVLTKKRWEIIQAMTGRGSMSVRSVGRLVNRDVKAVHGDVQVLLHAGILDKTEDGQVVFLHDAVKVDYTVGKNVGFTPTLPTADASKVRIGGLAPSLPTVGASKLQIGGVARPGATVKCMQGLAA
jgi:predicted transcriptional regulator